MKGMNFIFYRKGFSLVEVVTAIAVLTLCIMALLSTYYSIYKLQNKAMYDTLLQRKAETIFFTKLYPFCSLFAYISVIYGLWLITLILSISIYLFKSSSLFRRL